MVAARSRTARRVIAGLTPLVLIAAALAVMAPTCGGFTPGVKTFSKGSLIIPMDVCYQCSTDGDGSTSPSACGQASYVTPSGPGLLGGRTCPQATDAGDVIKAYGLVYQLIRNGVPVYWIIDPAKTHVDDLDLTVSYSGGPPVQRYDWNTASIGTAPTGATSISYMGGPFIVDGSDYAKASAILQANKATFSAVKVHVANIAFQAPVARTMAGGWTAGGTIPPKLALLDIGSGGQNAELVIRGYLIKAGLDFIGAGGTSAAGLHGQIYDRLTMTDFQPDASGLWTTTNLYKNGYQILWVPHWQAPGSCSDCTTSASTGSGTCPTATCSCTSLYKNTNPTYIANCLKTIGSFFSAGHDVFAECAGLGSFEGVNNGTPPNITGTNATYGVADATTHFQTILATPLTGGVWINASVSSSATFQPNNYTSPFMQIGDFVFRPYTGAINNFRPTAYFTAAPDPVTRFLTEPTTTDFDIFTMRPSVIHTPSQAGDHGTAIYLGGHSYSGCGGTFQTAGSRLVLNSLFNLGASCVASGVACSTGYLGVCATGTMTCNAATGAQECTPTVLPNTRTEICNGLDDNCNGLVDEGLTTGCYTGAPASRNVGLCHDGVQTCAKQPDGSYSMSSCAGEQLPSAEICDGLDNDCNNLVDDGLASVSCYDGLPATISPTSGLPMGMCKQGIQSCTNGSYGSCRICTAAEAAQPTPPADCQILPLAAEFCGGDGKGDGIDNNCNGLVDEGCGCVNGTTLPCYAGPAGTANVGACKPGTQTCVGTTWSSCVGQVLPIPEICGNTVDDDCNGIKDDPLVCNLCPVTPQSCYDGAPATLTPPLPVADNATCKAGVRACTAGVFGACEQQILPSPELCDGKDNNCNGTIDEGASCGTGFQCVNGLCVFGSCAPEFPCPEGYNCTGINPVTGVGSCTAVGCGVGPTCKAGFRCLSGTCVDPCLGINCAPGSICAGGLCTGGSCYSTPCGSGLICQNGGCVADPCASVACPSGTFCRGGDCVQECTFVTCGPGQRCGLDGFCVADPCGGVTCPASKPLCDASTGLCEADLCANLSCGAGQMCEAGFCLDDPCATIDCPVGICYRAQCFPSGNPTGAGTPPAATPESKPSGCGCATGSPSPALVLLGILALPLARRRRGRPGGGMTGLSAIALAVGLTGLLSGCPSKKETPVDLSGCAETCGEQRCVDVASDAAHCGKCSTPCVSGEICVDAMCGPGSPVAPYIRAVAPGSAARGSASVAIAIDGERFQSGATLRIIRPPALPTNVATSFTDSQHLHATVDVSTDPTSTIYVRIVNPDKVISPVYPFQIVPVSPAVTAWTPSPLTIKVGPTPATLHAVGTGLTTASMCHLFSMATSIDQALPTLNQTGTALDCTLDTTGLALGQYELWVVNDGLLPSAPRSTLSLTSDALTISSLSPSSGAQGAAQFVSVTVYGSGFVASPQSIVYLSTASGGTVYAAQATTFLDPTRLLVQFDLKPGGVYLAASPPPYNVKVSNGAIDSNVLPFSVISNPATASGVSFLPQPIYQNATETVTVTGANLPPNTIVQVLKPGSLIPISLPTTWNSASQVTGTLALTPTSNWPSGSYQILLSFPTSGTTSASFPFTVLSNGAVLSSVTPAGDPQGTTGITLSLTGSNFFSGMHLFAYGLGAGGTDLDLVATVLTKSSATAGTISLAGANTGLYQIAARNVGAADSNSLAFNVTPGPPTLTSVDKPTITRSTLCATPSPPPEVVTLTGTNFAKPDASGGGGSTVATWNTNLGIATAPLPASSVQVLTPTSIAVTIDTCAVYPGGAANPYTVQVWNPGGVTPPQKSGTLNVVVNP